MKNLLFTVSLIALILVVIIDYIYLQHETRNQFVELQGLIDEKNNLNANWGRLQIEHSYYVNNAKIEIQAKNQLGMKLPQREHVLSIKR
ncbi:MAG: cell division protein FtsL [Proteobacteria bacterium]|nr:cell division protein FtsL [Pseudomonadota bacterium]